MALQLEILEISTGKNVSMKTDKTTASLSLTNNQGKDQTYELGLVKLTFQKKMYQPTEVTATIAINSKTIADSRGQRETWNDINKETLVTSFFKKQVKLTSEGDSSQSIGEDFYVQDVLPTFKKDSIILTLKIYSPDKLMTFEHTSRTFVSKKLGGDILKGIKQSDDTRISLLPCLPFKSDTRLSYDITNMKVLAYTKKYDVQKENSDEYETKEVTTEHIFPYLVQYNESLYDMLARTCNRWGEFMYYENGKLNIGYSTAGKEVITNSEASKNKFNTITYVNIDEVESGDHFDRAANSDDNMTEGNLLKKDPNDLGLKADKMIMKEFSAFFKNDKSIPTYIGNRLFDNAYDLATKAISMAYHNSEFNNKYFTDKLRNDNVEKFNGTHSSYDSCNLFTEFKSDADSFDFSNDKYGSILSKEYAAAKDSVCINFDTNYPGLKLGQVIEVYSKEYIVVQIDCKPNYQQKILNSMWVVDNNDNPTLVYQVIATAKDADTNFYPTMIPSGHVRFADPQMATVFDASDPAGNGRVRVHFPWQATYDSNKKPTYKDDEATPWLQFTANAGGKQGIMGKHYKDDTVFVGFLDGNVERPYVLGAMSKGAGSDVHCATPGGHILKLNDDPSGISKFITGMLLPGWGTLSDFVPQMGELPETKGETGIKLGGGFELSDYYGIYKISGSTDSREINVASPWGDVNINAFTGITISAPNGDVSIKGKNVSIEAGNNLKLVSGTNVNYKLKGDDGLSGFLEDIGVAVAKKLADKVLSLVTIDLSIIRSIFEIVMRPTEGKMLVKSNRYLMLESGKGECDYPSSAYKDAATVEKLVKKAEEKDLRPGLKLSSGVQQMVTKVNDFGDDINSDYLTKYNTCVDKRKAYDEFIDQERIARWSNDYDASTAQHPKVCDKFDAIKDAFWKDGTDLLKEDDLKFEASYSVKDADVDLKVFRVLDTVKRSMIGYSIVDKRKKIASYRANHRKKILEKANELRQAIIDFREVQNLTDDKLQKYLAFKDVTIPKAFKNAFVKALNKDNFKDDAVYFKAFTEDQKKLKDPYDILNTDPFAESRKYIKRKAVVLMLEEMGFKDDWRQKVPDPDWVRDNPLLPIAQAPKVLEVKRDVTFAKLKENNDWDKYVDSIVTVPPLSADQWKITKELMKSVNALKENYTSIYDSYQETKSWGEAKMGGILFSSDENVYRLSNNIDESPTPWKENLTSADDTATNKDVDTFLRSVRLKMKLLG